MRRKGSCAGMSAGTARLGSAPRGPLLTLAAPPGRPIRPLAERFQLAVELGIDICFSTSARVSRRPHKRTAVKMARDFAVDVGNECAVTAAGLPARMKGNSNENVTGYDSRCLAHRGARIPQAGGPFAAETAEGDARGAGSPTASITPAR